MSPRVSLGSLSATSCTSSQGRVRRPRVESEMSKNDCDHQVTRLCSASKKSRERCARSGKREGGMLKAVCKGWGSSESRRAWGQHRALKEFTGEPTLSRAWQHHLLRMRADASNAITWNLCTSRRIARSFEVIGFLMSVSMSAGLCYSLSQR